MSASFSITIEGKGTFTASIADPEASVTVGTNTPASFTAEVAPVGPAGAAGATGPAGVVAATAPIVYTSGTQTVSMDTAYFVRSPSTAGTDGQILSWDGATTRPLWIDNAARTLFSTVRNETGATLTAGTVVYISGASGNKPLVTKAQANSESSSSRTFAVIATAIANNQNGTAIVAGELGKLDTTAYAEGATLYLSPTTAGTFTTTKPVAPNHLVYIGTVTRVHSQQGTIEVKVQNGSELDEMADVLLTSETDKDLLAYESSSSLWKNKSISTLGLATQSYVTSQGYITSSALTGYATESFVTSQGFITASALSPYLTSATAASTYQTQAGMSSYLTTASASSTYQTQAGMSSYLTTSTASSTYQTQAGMSSYLTTASASSTYQTQAGMSSYATLASPTFTGDPKAPTPSAGDNDTSIATTAFVTTANPDATTSVKGHVQLATDAEAKSASDATKAITATGLTERAMSGGAWWLQGIAFTTATSGTGASASGAVSFNKTANAPTTAVGYGMIYTQGYGITGIGKSYNSSIDWSKRVIMSARLHKSLAATDANAVVRLTLGKLNTVLTPADLSVPGIGIKIAGSGAVNITCHNGTSLTTSATSFTPTTSQYYDLVLISDGAGNVTCYVNGSQVGTTTGGPTSQSGTSARNMITFEAENLATITGSTNQYSMSNWYLYIAP